MFCLDTCICIDFLRGRTPEFYDLLQRTDPQLVLVPSVVAAELLVGAEKSSDPLRARNEVERLLLPFKKVPFDESCAYHYGKLRADLERRGCVIGGNDMMIAATALANNATLVTNNVREFKRIPGFSLEAWALLELDAEE